MQDFSIGRTLSRTFQLVGNGFSSAGLFLLILYMANTAVSAFVQPLMMEDMVASMNPTDPTAALGIFSSVWYWVTVVVGLAFMGLMYAGSIHGYVKVARGKEVTLSECFEVGLAKLLPMVGLMILWGIALTFGFVLLIVPGLILLTIWSVVMPALVSEGQGVIDSFGRSRALTRGSRLSVFGLLLILIIVSYVVMIVIVGGMIGGAAFTGNLNPEQLSNMGSPVVLIVSALVGWAMAMVTIAAVAAIYIELVMIKEGSPTGELGNVFG